MKALRSLAFSREEFAADRLPILERADDRVRPAVEAGLRSMSWNDVLDEAGRVFLLTASQEGAAPSRVRGDLNAYKDALLDTLRQVKRSGDFATQVDRLTALVSTSAVNAGTVAAASLLADEVVLEWVTMHDESVRVSHREADGQQVPVGATFNIAGHDLHYPGEPSGPPEVWINCRCVVRPAAGDEMARLNQQDAPTEEPTQQFAAEDEQPEVDPEDIPSDEEIDDDLAEFTEDDWNSLDSDVEWHGILAPVGVMSGDRRKFRPGGISTRELPVPLKFMPKDLPGHDESVVVGNIEQAAEVDGLVRGSGKFRSDDPHTADAIDMIATEMLRGVSVDLDAITTSFEDDDGNPFDFDTADIDGPMPVMVVDEGRIASSTLCAIPAFQEAWVALGPWEDEGNDIEDVAAEDDEFAKKRGKKNPADDSDSDPADTLGASAEQRCLPCEALEMVESHSVEHAEEFGRLIDRDEPDIAPAEFVALDGTKYVFEQHGTKVFAPGTHDGPGWITNPKETQRLRSYWTKGKGAAKIRWGTGGDFNRCRKQLAKYVTNPNYLAGTCANLHKVALGYWPGDHARRKALAAGGTPAPAFTLIAEQPDALVAAGALPPPEWFIDPGLEGPTPLTVRDGRVFGHLATWGTCHISFPGQCTEPPQSEVDYAYFRTGEVETTGGPIAVGNITMGTGHADLHAGARTAAAHYDNTGTVVADVAAGEDEYGIWVAGALRPGLSDETVAALRAGALSGDWRMIRGNRELVAALAVNVPGFPIPRTALAASGTVQTALVASGIVTHEEEPKAAEVATLDPAAFAREVVAEIKKEEARTQRLAAERRKMHAARLAEARARLEQEG